MYTVCQDIKAKRKYDKTGTFDVHKYLGKNKKYIYLEDKEGVKWALENVYAEKSGRKGLFPYYDEVKNHLIGIMNIS